MNRNYSMDRYREWTAMLRKYCPDLALSTDCLIGFPGETDADFELTCRVVEELGFSRVHIFPYSRRPLTRAADLPEISRSVIKERAAILKQVAGRSAASYRERFRGEKVEVLVESITKEGTGSGLERHYLRAIIRGPGLKPGGIFPGRVIGIEGDELRTELISG
jgi:threonylcarbamoyladenosine tRNA methylthiotransferase MtaB